MENRTRVPVAVVMISLNEAHNMEAVLANISSWAQEVFLVDSYSRDATIDIALKYGVSNFGDQWNFAVRELPITAPWTMKLDPDERISDVLKAEIAETIAANNHDGISIERRLFFMGRPMPIRQEIVRLWRTGNGRFTDVDVNEHPIVAGRMARLLGELEHHDSPDLEHWIEKQNRYTSAEAVMAYKQHSLADRPRLLGTRFQRRMWLKRNFKHIPFRFALLFLYNWLFKGAFRAGRVGYIWSQLRSDVMWLREIKRKEMELTGNIPVKRFYGPGQPDPRVRQYD
jgi:glycosyltransferase involved in cell wall biosynthesis